MRQPFGSSWRVTSELRMRVKKPMPTKDVTKVRREILHGFRDRGRRPEGLESAVFSISSESSRVSEPGESPVSRGAADTDCKLEARVGFSTMPLRACASFQLRLVDRRLRADESLEAGFGRGSSFVGA